MTFQSVDSTHRFEHATSRHTFLLRQFVQLILKQNSLKHHTKHKIQLLSFCFFILNIAWLFWKIEFWFSHFLKKILFPICSDTCMVSSVKISVKHSFGLFLWLVITTNAVVQAYSKFCEFIGDSFAFSKIWNIFLKNRICIFCIFRISRKWNFR